MSNKYPPSSFHQRPTYQVFRPNVFTNQTVRTVPTRISLIDRAQILERKRMQTNQNCIRDELMRKSLQENVTTQFRTLTFPVLSRYMHFKIENCYFIYFIWEQNLGSWVAGYLITLCMNDVT
jgi:hypothetical protein